MYNLAGDEVNLILPTDLYLQNTVCIPKNTIFTGKIVKLQKAKIGNNGGFQVIFHTLTLPEGQKVNVMGHIWSKEGNGLIGGESTQRTSIKNVPHYIQGISPFLQKIPDGPRAMGKETEITAGTEWIIVLDRDIELMIEKE